MKERNISLDAMKGFVILLVMVGHILILNKINDAYIYPMIEAVQMPVFMMISGYISGFKKPVSNFLEWRQVLSKRGVTYVLPFFTWLFLKQWDDLPNGIINTLQQLDRGLWFLMTLFLLNMLLYTTQLLNRKCYQKSKIVGFFGFCVIFGGLLAVFFVQFILGNTFLSPELTIRYAPAFLLGYLICFYQESLEKVVSKNLLVIGFIASLVVFVSICIIKNINSISFVGQIITGLFGCFVIFYIFLKSKGNVIKSHLALIGRYTLEIYTVHFHFAQYLNLGELNFTLYSIEGLFFVIATFIVMSVMSAGLIYMAKQNAITNLFLFGRRKG